MKEISLDSAQFLPTKKADEAFVTFKISGKNLKRFRKMADETSDDGEFKKFLETILTTYKSYLAGTREGVAECSRCRQRIKFVNNGKLSFVGHMMNDGETFCKGSNTAPNSRPWVGYVAQSDA